MIQKIENKYHGPVSAHRRRLMVQRLELQSLLRDPRVDKERIQAMAKEMGEVREAIFQMMIEYQIAIRNVLTPEQTRRWCTMTVGHPSPKGWKDAFR